jgi:L,D-transpeptidase catalytic domain
MFGLRFLERELQKSGSRRAGDSGLIGRALYTIRCIAIVFNSKVRAEVLSMRRVLFGAACIIALAFVALSSAAHANVLVRVDRATQTMDVSVDGASVYRWPVSTGRRGFGTPSGTFRPQRMAARWFSTVYYNAPMPHAIFFHGGYAIHGSYDIARLGGPASHGCIRLHPSAAAALFGIVQREGMHNTTVVVR